MSGMEKCPKFTRLMITGLGVVLLMAGSFASQTNAETAQEFKGKIAKSYEESQEWWPDPIRTAPGA